MRDPVTLLVSSAGRRVALIECFRADARALGIPLRVIAVDLRPSESSACQVADARYAAPRCTSPEFIPFIADLVEREKVDLIVPTIDTELLAYAKGAPTLVARGATVSICSPETVTIARDKLLTASHLERARIPVPRTAPMSEFLSNGSGWRWPLLAKPIDGSSSVGIVPLDSESDLAKLPNKPEGYIVQERWSGVEYTTNVYFDGSGQLQCAIPHRRIETRAGEVSKGRTEHLPRLQEIAQQIAAALPPCRGALCFQAIAAPDGAIAVFEFNARFGGGYPLAHAAGARFSAWLLEERLGLPSTCSDNWRAGVTMLRYDAAVFVG
jgi:carbamoyl-phosphate synthase large subunit